MQSCHSADVRTLLFERLDALLQDCEKVMNNADYGQVVNNLDDFLLIAGKQFVQDVFQQKLQDPIALETRSCKPGTQRSGVTGSLGGFDPVTPLRFVPGLHLRFPLKINTPSSSRAGRGRVMN